jgi:hypothetical protein
MSKVGICLEQGNQELILNPQNILEQPTLSTVLSLGNTAGNSSISGVNNLSATSITTPTLANGSSTLTVGTLGQITNIVGTLQNNGAELPAYISSAGVASGSIDMNSNFLTEVGGLDASGVLAIGQAQASLGVSIGRATQTTNLNGNIQFNSSSGASGEVLTSTGASTAPTFQALPTPYISSGGVASGSIDMNSNSITECNSLDSVSSLTLGGTTALGTTLGRASQTTNLVGNIRVNGSSGNSGEVLTSTGGSTAPTFQPLVIALSPSVQSNQTGNGTGLSLGIAVLRKLDITIVSGAKYLISGSFATYSSGGALQNSTLINMNIGQGPFAASPSIVNSVPITTNTGFLNDPLMNTETSLASVKFNNIAGEVYTLANSYVWTAPASSAGSRTFILCSRASGTITGSVVCSNYTLSVTRIV